MLKLGDELRILKIILKFVPYQHLAAPHDQPAPPTYKNILNTKEYFANKK